MSVRRHLSEWRVLLLALGFWLLPAACADETDRSSLPFAPADCEQNKPERGYLHLTVSAGTEFPRVPVAVYFGNIEDGHLAFEDTLTTSRSYEMFVEETYSATAQYVIGPDTVVVVNSGHVGVSEEPYRDKDCWTVLEGEIDLVLRVRP
jgi:hypothetical protein